jgi:glycosyltransferase involved in cell wall biosynthesis
VTKLLNDEPLRARLGAAGRRFAQSKLDARISAKAVMEVYDEVLAHAGR